MPAGQPYTGVASITDVPTVILVGNELVADVAPIAVVGSPTPLPVTVILKFVLVHGLFAPETLTVYMPLGISEGIVKVAVLPSVLDTPSISYEVPAVWA